MFNLTADRKFFDLFDRSAENMVRTAEKFREMLHNFDRRKEIFAIIHDYEHQGDDITHQTLERLDKTFITPLDREDIHNLIAKTDDVVDMLDSAAQRMILYGVEKPTDDVLKQDTWVQAIEWLGVQPAKLARILNGSQWHYEGKPKALWVFGKKGMLNHNEGTKHSKGKWQSWK